CDGLQARDTLAQTPPKALMALGVAQWRAPRPPPSPGVRRSAPPARSLRERLTPRAAAQFALPAQIGDYTDFYTSIHHATNIGRLFRPDNPLLPNYKWIPIGYHGRSSTLIVSGTDFRRPQGQTLPPGETVPKLGPSRRLDYELELGLLIGKGNDDALPIPIDAAPDHLFGVCLLNDWSARDIQAWEYQPLGPF